MNDAEFLDRANKAKAILESPIYQESYENTRKAIISRIESTPLADTQAAEDLRRCLKLLRDVRANLELAMSQGKVALFNIEREKSRKTSPLRNFFR